MLRTSLAILLALLSPMALAHPGGHAGSLLHNLIHLVSEPDHLAMLAVAVLAGLIGARLYRRRGVARNQPARR